jgi:hypothetical protein
MECAIWSIRSMDQSSHSQQIRGSESCSNSLKRANLAMLDRSHARTLARAHVIASPATLAASTCSSPPLLRQCAASAPPRCANVRQPPPLLRRCAAPPSSATCTCCVYVRLPPYPYPCCVKLPRTAPKMYFACWLARACSCCDQCFASCPAHFILLYLRSIFSGALVVHFYCFEWRPPSPRSSAGALT